MPEPLAICLEDLGAPLEAPRFLRCVVVVGREPGLRLDASGAVVWQHEGGAELWVSSDDKLILFRPADAPSVMVSRSGRTLDAPTGKPVVLLDGDELTTAGRRLRVHVHGVAPLVHAPQQLPAEALPRSTASRAAAAALALGAALGAAGCGGAVEVRDSPPTVAPPDPQRTPPSTLVEVRERPPAPPVRTPAATPTSTQGSAQQHATAAPRPQETARQEAPPPLTPTPIEIRERPPVAPAPTPDTSRPRATPTPERTQEPGQEAPAPTPARESVEH